MRILFTSDLHGNWTAINHFTTELSKPEYDFGVISGDILDDGIPNTEMDELYETTDLAPDDFLAELPGADEPYLDYLDKLIALFKDPDGPFLKALQIKEHRVREQLSSAGKPTFVVPGNHDQTTWTTDARIINLHDRRVEYGEYNLVGYRWTELDRSVREHEEDIVRLSTYVDRKTIFISHRPALGHLDQGTNGHKVRAHIGSNEIGMMIEKQKPLLHLFGHVHSGFGSADFRINGAYPISQSFVGISLSKGKMETTDVIPALLGV